MKEAHTSLRHAKKRNERNNVIIMEFSLDHSLTYMIYVNESYRLNQKWGRPSCVVGENWKRFVNIFLIFFCSARYLNNGIIILKIKKNNHFCEQKQNNCFNIIKYMQTKQMLIPKVV